MAVPSAGAGNDPWLDAPRASGWRLADEFAKRGGYSIWDEFMNDCSVDLLAFVTRSAGSARRGLLRTGRKNPVKH